MSLAVNTRHGSLVKVAVMAFLAMCASDLLATAMVVYESQLNALMAGLFDVAGYIAGLICAALALDEILKNGWRTRKSLIIIGAVSVANFAGTYAGVYLSKLLTVHSS